MTLYDITLHYITLRYMTGGGQLVEGPARPAREAAEKTGAGGELEGGGGEDRPGERHSTLTWRGAGRIYIVLRLAIAASYCS